MPDPIAADVVQVYQVSLQQPMGLGFDPKPEPYGVPDRPQYSSGVIDEAIVVQSPHDALAQVTSPTMEVEQFTPRVLVQRYGHRVDAGVSTAEVLLDTRCLDDRESPRTQVLFPSGGRHVDLIAVEQQLVGTELRARCDLTTNPFCQVLAKVRLWPD